MVCTCENLARVGGQLGQVKSIVNKISFIQGGWPYFGLHTHTHNRLDKPSSALAEARLKILKLFKTVTITNLRSGQLLHHIELLHQIDILFGFWRVIHTQFHF